MPEEKRIAGSAQRSADDYIRYFKITPCHKKTPHDWVKCFYAHPEERARRRDLATHPYAASMCSQMLHTGSCDKQDECPFAHGLFEYHLHPDKFRTKMCTDAAAGCKRNFCFFAHSLEELRQPPKPDDGDNSSSDGALTRQAPSSPSPACSAPSSFTSDATFCPSAETLSRGSSMSAVPAAHTWAFSSGGGSDSHGSPHLLHATMAMPSTLHQISPAILVPVAADTTAAAGGVGYSGSLTGNRVGSCIAGVLASAPRLLQLQELQLTAATAAENLAALQHELERTRQQSAAAVAALGAAQQRYDSLLSSLQNDMALSVGAMTTAGMLSPLTEAGTAAATAGYVASADWTSNCSSSALASSATAQLDFNPSSVSWQTVRPVACATVPAAQPGLEQEAAVSSTQWAWDGSSSSSSISWSGPLTSGPVNTASPPVLVAAGGYEGLSYANEQPQFLLLGATTELLDVAPASGSGTVGAAGGAAMLLPAQQQQLSLSAAPAAVNLLVDQSRVASVHAGSGQGSPLTGMMVSPSPASAHSWVPGVVQLLRFDPSGSVPAVRVQCVLGTAVPTSAGLQHSTT